MATQLAFVLLDGPDGGIAADSVLAQIRADWPTLAGATASQDGDGPIVIDHGDDMVAIMSIDAQIGDDVGDLAASSRFWPQGEPGPGAHTAHLIVTVFTANAPDDHTTAVAQAGLLSQIVASLTDVSAHVSGVYWGGAEHLIFPGVFREMTLAEFPTPLLPLWIAVNVGSRDGTRYSGYTRGLDALHLMDIEIPDSDDSANDILQRMVSIAEYEIDNGPVIGDGDTIGESETAEIVAHHTPSALGDGRTVLTLSAAQPKKRRFWR